MDSIWKKLYIFVCMEDRHESIEKVFSAIKSGDQRAFERVFRMFYVPLCDYAAMILGEQAEAEDVVQDLFMHIWRNRGTGFREILSVYFSAFQGFECVEA